MSNDSTAPAAPAARPFVMFKAPRYWQNGKGLLKQRLDELEELESISKFYGLENVKEQLDLIRWGLSDQIAKLESIAQKLVAFEESEGKDVSLAELAYQELSLMN
jgi:hypothetical protein